MSTPSWPASADLYALWDEMAGFDATHADKAIDHLMSRLCELCDAHNAVWVGAVRMNDISPDDPLHGWRAPLVSHLHPLTPFQLEKLQAEIKKLDIGVADITTIRNVELAGTWRSNRLIDIVDTAWFDSTYYRTYYNALGIQDAIWAGCPVNADTEIYFGLHRGPDRSRFSTDERDTVLAALRGLKWFFRQLLLGHGLLLASSPVTQAERRVLQLILAGCSEKQIASQLDRSQHTIHDTIVSIYRKFGVKNRASLMALWLGQMT